MKKKNNSKWIKVSQKIKNDTWGVYAIINSESKKIYVGSTKNIKKRIKGHYYDLLKNRHNNSYLQNSFNKYGEESFEIFILEVCIFGDKNYLLYREQHYIDYFIHLYSWDNLYNESKLATGGAEKMSIQDLKEGRGVITLEEFYKIVDLLENTNKELVRISRELKVPKWIVKEIYNKNM